MADLPMLTSESVTPTRPAPAVYRDSSMVSPAALGAGLGQGIQAASQDVDEMLYNERKLNAQLSAYSAEAKSGADLDQAMIDHKKDLLALKASPDVDYPAAVASLRSQYSEKIQKIQQEALGSLKDPISQKMFDVRMRLQIQAANRHMATVEDQQIASWDKMSTDGRIDGYVRRAGNVSGDMLQDVTNLSIQAGLAAKDLEDYHQRAGIPVEAHEKIVTKMEAGMANQALQAYGSNFQAGLSFLRTKIPGTEVSVGYDPSNPKGESILDGAETAKWVQHFIGHKQEKVGANLGEILFQDSKTIKGFSLEGRITELYKSGMYSPEELGKARQQFTAAVSHDHELHEIGISNTYDSIYKIVAQKYNGDVDLAIKNGGDQFARMWATLGPKQGNLRAAFAKEERLDPAAYGPLGKVLDLAGVPGTLSKTYPSTAAFAAEFQGPTKYLWPQALKLYEADVKRDTSQDVHYQNYKTDTEIRVRALTGWTSGKGMSGRGAWDEADPDQRALRTWVTAAAEQAWADHQQARKQTPGKVSDTLWYSDTLNDIMRQAEMLKKRGAFKKGLIPELGSSPESALRIKTQARAQRVIDGVSHEWDGTQWIPKKQE